MKHDHPSPKTVPLQIFGVVALLMFLFGSALGALVAESYIQPSNPTATAGTFDASQLQELYTTIQDQFVGTLPDSLQLEYGAAHGMVRALGDPHSMFFNPEEAKAFQDTLSGTFEGIGAEMGVDDKGFLVIIAPLPGLPAEKAGVLAGDRILSIDDHDTAELTVDEAVGLIRGEKGTSVKLTIGRGDDSEVLEIFVTRERIKTDSVRFSTEERNGKKIGMLNVIRFYDDTSGLVEDAVQEFLLQDVDGVILDLRNDPGGLLSAAIDVAGHFVGKQPVVLEESTKGVRVSHSSTISQSLVGIPVVVLVNEGSASASEILAGAIQDYHVGTLVGTRTFGKGSVQDVMSLDDGSVLKLTIARWLTPLGRSIENDGITPDETIEITDEDAAADRDPQLDRAFQILAP